jgi:hypothetical protein
MLYVMKIIENTVGTGTVRPILLLALCYTPRPRASV